MLPLRTLFWRTLVVFPLLAGVLYLTLPWLVKLLAMPASIAVKIFVPGLLNQVEATARALEFVTHIGLPVGESRGVYVVTVSPGIYAYSLPLFVALCIASQTRLRMTQAMGVLIVLMLAWTFSTTFDFLNSVFARIPIASLAELGLKRWHREVVAVGYQLGALMLPALIAPGLWLVFQPEWRQRLTARLAVGRR
jgi:hypothetical protein